MGDDAARSLKFTELDGEEVPGVLADDRLDLPHLSLLLVECHAEGVNLGSVGVDLGGEVAAGQPTTMSRSV